MLLGAFCGLSPQLVKPIVANKENAIKMLAEIAFTQNEEQENIGARRLHTVLEKLLEEISFYASDYDEDVFTVTRAYVETVFKPEEAERSYSKYLI